MASSFTLNCVVANTDSSTLNLLDENSSSLSERRFALCQTPQSLSLSAPISSVDTFMSNHKQQSVPITSRSVKGVLISGFAIAAATAVGLSFFSLDCFAMAAELDVSSTPIIPIASAHISQSLNTSPEHNPRSNSNPSSSPTPDLSFSMAIPVPHEEVWVFVQGGFVAPLPRNQGHGLAIPFPQLGKTAVAVSKGSTLRCPKWTPSELEMVLPDFHGRPKPFPRQGHHWSASFVMKGMNGEAFLQLSDPNYGIELNEIDGTTTTAVDANIDKQDIEGKRSLLKVLGMEKFTCYSM